MQVIHKLPVSIFHLLPIAFLWLPVIYLLGAQWSFYEQYNYGWAVVFLCGYLTKLRFDTRPTPDVPRNRGLAVTLVIILCVVFWLARILQEANPAWRLASWSLALTAVGITLALIYLAGGQSWLRHFAFPIAFFLIAVPWPTPMELLVIQNLTRLNTAVVVELLILTSIPAIAHGNVIEISSGSVGIDEACSGIRSLQAVLMIALFFGELYRLPIIRRICLGIAGLALAMIFNVGRTYFLAWIAARDGIPAIDKWHDPAGIAILIACFLALWIVALLLRRRVPPSPSACENAHSVSCSTSPIPAFSVRLSACLLLWLAFVAISTEFWFRSHEQPASETVQWAAQWPVENPTYRMRTLPEATFAILRFDASSAGSWQDEDGRVWQGFYLRWHPGRNFYERFKVALAKSHSPEICLSASGWRLERELPPATIAARPGLQLTFRRYEFVVADQTVQVFFAVIEDQTDTLHPGFLRQTHLDRLLAALAGSRNYGQRTVEVAVTGFDSPELALETFRQKLPHWLSPHSEKTDGEADAR